LVAVLHTVLCQLQSSWEWELSRKLQLLRTAEKAKPLAKKAEQASTPGVRTPRDQEVVIMRWMHTR
jgi:hypothetical protein